MLRAFSAEEKSGETKKGGLGGVCVGWGWGLGGVALTFEIKLVDIFQRLMDKVETSKSLKRKKERAFVKF